jgi:hypothetical protein
MTIRIEAPDADEWAASLRVKDYRYAKPGVEATPWGRETRSREPSAFDPLHIGETELIVVIEGDHSRGIVAQRQAVLVL